MKQFEEWWEKNHPIYDSGDDTIREYQQAKAAWKAALEWIKDKDAEQVRSIVEEELAC